MTTTRLAWLSLLRRRTATVIVTLSMALATLSSGLLVSQLDRVGRFIETVRSDYDLFVGPKSSRLRILLECTQLWEPNEEVIPYSLNRAIEKLVQPRQIIPMALFAKH